MDLWGKYPIQSINGNQYFHTFLDDSTRRPSLSSRLVACTRMLSDATKARSSVLALPKWGSRTFEPHPSRTRSRNDDWGKCAHVPVGICAATCSILTGESAYQGLREFGSPVYVLLQGSQKQPKLLPKSKQQIFVGSRNYQFLTNLPRQPGTPESIVVELPPAVPREGEHDGGQPNSTTKEIQQAGGADQV